MLVCLRHKQQFTSGRRLPCYECLAERINVSCSQKIERLKSALHLLDADGKNPNKHVFFFDTKKEGKI